MESVTRWRAAPGFHERVARLQEVLDDFEPRRLRSCPSAEKAGGTLASVIAAKEAAAISPAVAFPTEGDIRR